MESNVVDISPDMDINYQEESIVSLLCLFVFDSSSSALFKKSSLEVLRG